MKQGIVEDKEYRQDYESGSGSLYIPVLGRLFPKLFGEEMNPVGKWYLVVRQESLYRYRVSREVYDSIAIGEEVEIGIDKYGMPEVKPLKKSRTDSVEYE